MNDYYEIDFLDVGSKRSGDAIALRYRVSGRELIHVVDGGYQATGDALVNHIRRYYGDPQYIDHVVVTHNDGDHAGGLRSLFGTFTIGTLWMLRPWLYAGELIHVFRHYRSVQNLEQRLRELYPNLVELEQLALQTGTPIEAPFQGAQIGAFRAAAPGKDRYLRCIVESERTPEAVSAYEPVQPPSGGLAGMLSAMTAYASAKWGEERFSAVISAAKDDSQHPRRTVVRACHHRGSGKDTLSTEKGTVCLSKNSPHYFNRGWAAAQPLAYPESQEA